ncbi:hypothetical protein TSOC_005066 [Tetrabaena socialis]|uniref:MYND-type domain-containing protein n=1 Tax=Tetrabaena socialis TaxID=47790 RepID=A0A2J8A732_9CHLO|nr:hypothetical protein TSOC_005066 [Tetrabaena socialis]|eukprot:PNH08346.1 hypothetical protein TSOC_005066 [Tetrabaena socialis]
MESDAEPSLEECIRRLREVIDAATLNAPAPPTGASASDSSQPPTANGPALARLYTELAAVQAQHPPCADWAEPLVQHGIVPAAVALLQHILLAYRHSPSSFQPPTTTLPEGAGEGPAPAKEADQEDKEADHVLYCLVAVRTAALLVSCAAESLVEGALVHVQLWEQLAARATLQALADAARGVEAEVWPAQRAAAAAGGGAQDVQGPAGSCELASHAAVVLSSVALSVSCATELCSGGADDATWAAARQQLLAALKDSGVLSALSAALLSAPPCPEVAPDAEALDDATHFMAAAQSDTFDALEWLATGTVTWAGLEAVTALLAAPDVQRLRWAALEQLAGSGPSTAGDPAAAPDGAASAQGVQEAAAAPSVVRLHDTAARLAAARRLLPPPRRLAALAAACSRTLCLEVEVELQGLALGVMAPGADPDADSVRATCMGLVKQLADLAFVSDTLAEAEARACAPDVLAFNAWALRALAAGGGGAAVPVGGDDEEEEAEEDRTPAGDAGHILHLLCLKLNDWRDFSPATQAAYVQRLLPTGLMRSLDCLLRHLAATGPRTQRGRGTAAECLLLLSYLLPDMLRSHIVATPGAGGGGAPGGGGEPAWHPQDEVGLLVTAAKLATHEAARPGGLVVDPYEMAAGGPGPLALTLATSLASAAEDLVNMLTALARPARRPQRGRGPAAPVLGRPPEADLATAGACEAIALASLTALPILERLAPDTPGGLLDLHSAVRLLTNCLAQGVQLLPPAELLALQPQRTLALLGRLLRRTRHGRGGGGFEQGELPHLAGAVVGALVHMAADTRLAGAVAGWLRGGRAAPSLDLARGGGGLLDPEALAEALRPWDVAGAAEGMHDGHPEGLPARLPDGVRGNEPPPAWPPRVLRLCANPGCTNFAGPAEADLPLLMCNGCQAVWYCGQGCQRQHWRATGHRGACAGLRAAREAAAGGG